MVKYIYGGDLPDHLQRVALDVDRHRYTGDHRPAWLDGPFVREGRKSGPPDFDDDAHWLANTEFPVAGTGKGLKLATNGQKPRVHYLRDIALGAGFPVTTKMAGEIAVAVAKATGKAVFVMVEGRVGDMTFSRPTTGLPTMWRVATPKGELL